MPDRTTTSAPSRDLESPDIPVLAGDLRMVVGQLVRRFREDRTLPGPQIAALGWLVRRGPKTTSQLAAHERVRPQSMAYTVAELETAGLVERRPDPTDKRQTLIVLTAAGNAVMDEFSKRGESWVAEAIESRLSVTEQADLARGVALLGRLVDET